MAKQKLDIVAIVSSNNIAELLDEDKLNLIGSDCVEQFEDDFASCDEYFKTIKDAMKIAKQLAGEKTTPWPGASNVMYPLIATACMSFAARTYPEIVRNGRVVQTAVLGSDPTGEKEQRAKRITDHMNAQLLVEDSEWESDMDRLLPCLAVLGTVYKKTFWDEYYRKNRSIMCQPDEVIVNNNIRSLETAKQITHILYMTRNDILARIRCGMYCDIEEVLADNENVKPQKSIFDGGTHTPENDQVLECHCLLDLDDDGYDEPYIVTVHRATQKVLRIYRRFDPENVFANDAGKIYRIDPCSYFTPFFFFRSPDGTWHGSGFGQLLLPINATINATINQLIDSGTLTNLKTGFISRDFKVKSGSNFSTPGELKKVDISSEALQKGIMMLPVGEPSSVLFQLLGVMIDAGRELASVSEVLQGQALPQNAPATTTLALIEQGQVAFKAIQKRIYASLKSEFGKLYRLNRLYLDDYVEYKDVLQTLIISREDYTDQDLSVIPVADPTMSSDAQRLARAQAMLQILPMVPPAGGQIILRQWLEALSTPDALIEAILPPPDPNAPPSPEQMQVMMEQQKAQAAVAELQMNMHLKAQELDLKSKQTDLNAAQVKAQIDEANARIQKMFMDAMLEKEKLQAQYQVDSMDHSIKAIEAAAKVASVENEKIAAETKRKVDSIE